MKWISKQDLLYTQYTNYPKTIPDDAPLSRYLWAEGQVVSGNKLPAMTNRERALLYKGGYGAEWVYFVASVDAGLIKIGKTKSLSKRINALRSGSPVEIRPIWFIRWAGWIEDKLHRQFSGIRSHGEWFCADQPLLDYIKYCKETPNNQIAKDLSYDAQSEREERDCRHNMLFEYNERNRLLDTDGYNMHH